jgi:hypothetical protein
MDYYFLDKVSWSSQPDAFHGLQRAKEIFYNEG